MSEKEKNELLKKTITTYGTLPQLIMAIEEMSELTKEISKYFRGEDNVDYILEEIADCKIMIAQLEVIFGSSNHWEEKKLLRLRDRLNKEERTQNV